MSSQNENKIKHLEFIQLTITRMNINSFMIKGWLVTIVAAIFVLSEKNVITLLLFVIPVISLLLWIMDGFFVSTERKYRGLYDVVRRQDESTITYSMDVSMFTNKRYKVISCMFSITLMLFYPIVIFSSLLAAYLSKG